MLEFIEVYKNISLQEATSAAFVERWQKQAWLLLCMCGLNALNGTPTLPVSGRWTQAERAAAGSIASAVERRLATFVENDALTESAWQKDMKSRQVGYNGEEISTCHELTWDQVIPSLPPEQHGGSINSLDWVGERTREFLLDPTRLLKDPSEISLPKLPGKVHIKSEDRFAIASELVRRNICDWLPLSEVYEVKGQKILNGLFGVSKPTLLASGQPVLRLIMNLTGSNSTQEQLEGGCSTLPGITAWQSIVVDAGEHIKLFQSDMSSAFYLFKIPKVWQGHLAFNIVVPGSSIGRNPLLDFALVCNVIPMGWLNSVGIMQEISENLVKKGRVSCLGQVLKGTPLPAWMNDILKGAEDQERTWFHVYLDNFCAGERVMLEQQSTKGILCHEQVEQAWGDAGVISSAKKKVVAASRVTELGAEVDGHNGTLGVGNEKLLPLIQGTLWLVSQPYLNRKHVQIMAGRWVFVLQFRRPAMAILQQVWKFISGYEKVTEKMRRAVRTELLQLVLLSPLLHCNLSAPVEEKVIATDASERGCAISAATSLTSTGLDFLQATRKIEGFGSSEAIPILIVSLFNGIGGCFRCYDIVGVSPMGRIAVECDPGANKITQKRWPGTIIINDVKLVDRALVRSWSSKFPRIQEVHVWAGFPCTDLSAVKFNRANLKGSNSKLFWEIPRIEQLIQEEFGPEVVVKSAVENVASMDQDACKEISEERGSWPYHLDPVHAVPMKRPRFAWVSESLEGVFPDISFHSKRYWTEVVAMADYPNTEQWLEPEHEWAGERVGATFPTCMKAIVRQHPPPRPAGIEKCDNLTIQRWTEDSFRYPPYQYDWRYIISTPNTWRLLSAEEKELLLGYGYKHTEFAWPASRVKQSPQGFDDARHSYLGDSFSIYSFCIVAAAFVKRFLPGMSYKHVANRMGMSPGFRAHVRSIIPLMRGLAYGSDISSIPHCLGMEQFNRLLLRRTNHTGSDVRVISGALTNPKSFPRESVAASWWEWKDEFRKRWQSSSHINVLELEAVLLGIKHQIQRFKTVDKRIFQISDSYVCISVCSKGRSGSLQLNRVLRHISALLLTFGLQLVMAHVDSLDNPSDRGSRL